MQKHQPVVHTIPSTNLISSTFYAGDVWPQSGRP
jgi:hypothetical protein